MACIAPPSGLLGPCTEFSRDCVSSTGDCRSRVPSSLLRGDPSPSKGRRCCWCDRRGHGGVHRATRPPVVAWRFRLQSKIPTARHPRGHPLTHLASPRPSLLASYLVSSVSKGRAQGPPSELHARVPTNAGGASRLGFSGDCVGARFRSFAEKARLQRCTFWKVQYTVTGFAGFAEAARPKARRRQPVLARTSVGARTPPAARRATATTTTRPTRARAAQAESKSEPSRFRAASRAGAADTLSPEVRHPSRLPPETFHTTLPHPTPHTPEMPHPLLAPPPPPPPA